MCTLPSGATAGCPLVTVKTGAAVESHCPHVSVGGEVELLLAAIRAKNNLGVVNNRPLVRLGIRPTQGACRRERKDAHALRADGVNVSIRPDRDPDAGKRARILHERPLDRAVRIIRVNQTLRGHVDRPIRVHGDAFAPCASHQPLQASIRGQRVEMGKGIDRIDCSVRPNRRAHQRVGPVLAEAPVYSPGGLARRHRKI